MKVYVIAGEDSGDLHGANLIKALRNRLPQLEVRGVGGDKLAQEGTTLIAHIRDINFMGFWEVLSHLPTIRELFKKVKSDVKSWNPDFVVLIDYPGFNLRIAKYLYKQGLTVIYYISPQVWAWKKERVKTIKQYTHRMLVILPFEKKFYEEEGLEVDFVGHPLLDAIGEDTHTSTASPTIALLPGSRKQEIKRMLPTMLQLTKRLPEFRYVVAGAPSQDAAFYAPMLAGYEVELIMNQTYEVLRQADYAVVASGTATLETALFLVPQVVVYKGSPVSYHIGKRLVQVDFIAMVNLILGKRVVAELIQDEFNVDRLTEEIRTLTNAERQLQVKQDYQQLRILLGEGGASAQAADKILQYIEKK